MNPNVAKVQQELEGMGYATSITDSPHGEVVSFPYRVETGTRSGSEVRLGVSFQGEEPYPEYPPHWIHVCPPIDDGRGGAIEIYADPQGDAWGVLSRPPGDRWDRLPTKHMAYYISEHLRAFWKSL